MSVSKTASFWIAAVMAAAIAAPASAQQPSDAHVKDLVQQALAQTQAGAPPQQPSATAPAEGPKIDLGINEAVQRALERNLDLQVARLNPRLWDFSIASALAT
jgi:hypothetical protein